MRAFRLTALHRRYCEMRGRSRQIAITVAHVGAITGLLLFVAACGGHTRDVQAASIRGDTVPAIAASVQQRSAWCASSDILSGQWARGRRAILVAVPACA